MLASIWNGALQVGVTTDLIKRVWERKSDFVEGFTERYRVHDLVWFEQHETIESAILREKPSRNGSGARKTRTIETIKPRWRDFYPDLLA
ncbi:MAG: GIY-YIG nuclease family protein [Dokdonella sp.]|uniref:GIY-YIG nuclease family protein n=1 Tax=Dokdonella sp. TaxID=2291710 RepID=UPI003F7D953D